MTTSGGEESSPNRVRGALRLVPVALAILILGTAVAVEDPEAVLVYYPALIVIAIALAALVRPIPRLGFASRKSALVVVIVVAVSVWVLSEKVERFERRRAGTSAGREAVLTWLYDWERALRAVEGSRLPLVVRFDCIPNDVITSNLLARGILQKTPEQEDCDKQARQVESPAFAQRFAGRAIFLTTSADANERARGIWRSAGLKRAPAILVFDGVSTNDLSLRGGHQGYQPDAECFAMLDAIIASRVRSAP